MFSEKFLKYYGNILTEKKLETLLKIKDLESKIEESQSTLNYLATQISGDNNIIKTLEFRIEVLQKDLDFLWALESGLPISQLNLNN